MSNIEFSAFARECPSAAQYLYKLLEDRINTVNLRFFGQNRREISILKSNYCLENNLFKDLTNLDVPLSRQQCKTINQLEMFKKRRLVQDYKDIECRVLSTSCYYENGLSNQMYMNDLIQSNTPLRHYMRTTSVEELKRCETMLSMDLKQKLGGQLILASDNIFSLSCQIPKSNQMSLILNVLFVSIPTLMEFNISTVENYGFNCQQKLFGCDVNGKSVVELSNSDGFINPTYVITYNLASTDLKKIKNCILEESKKNLCCIQVSDSINNLTIIGRVSESNFYVVDEVVAIIIPSFLFSPTEFNEFYAMVDKIDSNEYISLIVDIFTYGIEYVAMYPSKFCGHFLNFDDNTIESTGTPDVSKNVSLPVAGIDDISNFTLFVIGDHADEANRAIQESYRKKSVNTIGGAKLYKESANMTDDNSLNGDDGEFKSVQDSNVDELVMNSEGGLKRGDKCRKSYYTTHKKQHSHNGMNTRYSRRQSGYCCSQEEDDSLCGIETLRGSYSHEYRRRVPGGSGKRAPKRKTVAVFRKACEELRNKVKKYIPCESVDQSNKGVESSDCMDVPAEIRVFVPVSSPAYVPVSSSASVPVSSPVCVPVSSTCESDKFEVEKSSSTIEKDVISDVDECSINEESSSEDSNDYSESDFCLRENLQPTDVPVVSSTDSYTDYDVVKKYKNTGKKNMSKCRSKGVPLSHTSHKSTSKTTYRRAIAEASRRPKFAPVKPQIIESIVDSMEDEPSLDTDSTSPLPLSGSLSVICCNSPTSSIHFSESSAVPSYCSSAHLSSSQSEDKVLSSVSASLFNVDYSSYGTYLNENVPYNAAVGINSFCSLDMQHIHELNQSCTESPSCPLFKDRDEVVDQPSEKYGEHCVLNDISCCRVVN